MSCNVGSDSSEEYDPDERRILLKHYRKEVGRLLSLLAETMQQVHDLQLRVQDAEIKKVKAQQDLRRIKGQRMVANVKPSLASLSRNQTLMHISQDPPESTHRTSCPAPQAEERVFPTYLGQDRPA
jgi:predicted  nucleic acid-binding Zn-ribbon protein